MWYVCMYVHMHICAFVYKCVHTYIMQNYVHTSRYIYNYMLRNFVALATYIYLAMSPEITKVLLIYIVVHMCSHP